MTRVKRGGRELIVDDAVGNGVSRKRILRH